MICGFEDIDEIVMRGKVNLEWLRKFLTYRNKLPTPKTVREILSRLDNVHFKEALEK